MLHDLAGVVVDGKPLCISCAERAGHDLTTEQQHAGRVLFNSELEGDTHCSSCGHCFDHPECTKPLFTVECIKAMSKLRRGNFERRLRERVAALEQSQGNPGQSSRREARKLGRAFAILGRFSAIDAKHPPRS